jgi:hypothetical protein
MKLVRLIKICLNETYSEVPVGQHLSDNFAIHSGLRQGDALSPQLFNFGLEYGIWMVQENHLGHISFCLMPMMQIHWKMM